MKLFVDNNPNKIYTSNDWIDIPSDEFISKINDCFKTLSLPNSISFGDINKEDLKNHLDYLVNTIININFNMPKIYYHGNDRSMNIFFENALTPYTKKTNRPFTFEHIF